MRCREIMKPNVESVREEDSVLDAAKKMRVANVGFLPVCDDERHVLGTMTDRDIVLRVVAADKLPSEVRAAEAMTREAVTCSAEDDVRDAEKTMAKHQKSRIMVVDDEGKIEGVISLSDIADHEEPVEAGRTLHDVSSREVRHY